MGLVLDGLQRRELRLILNAVFDRATFTRELDETTSRKLEDLVKPSKFDDELYQLIDNANSNGWVHDLLLLVERNTQREDILERVRKLHASSQPLRAVAVNGLEDGDAVVRLCNRVSQEQALFSAFQAPMCKPAIYLLPGDSEAAHASFIDRFRYYTLPLLLGEARESFRDVTEPITLLWSDQLPFLTTQLARKADPKVMSSASAFRSLQKFTGKIVIIHHLAYESRWTANTVKAMEQYLNFWSQAAEANGQRPWFVIFISLILDLGDGAPILAELQTLADTVSNAGCGITLLPPLGLVEFPDVDLWIQEHWSEHRNEARPLLTKLFPTKSTRLPMAIVEQELGAFVARL